MAGDGSNDSVPYELRQAQPDPELEAKARELTKMPLHPVVEKIQHRSGWLNMIRNARNQKQVALDDIDKQS